MKVFNSRGGVLIINYVLLVFGFILLIKGADYFVDGSANIACFLKIPSLVIGLTLVAFGTSAPEASVSIVASLHGESGIAIGNVIGSNLFNLLMVVGCSGVIQTLIFEGSLLKREFPLLLFSSTLLILLSIDLTLSRVDGIILLILFFIFLYYVIITAIKSDNNFINQDKIYFKDDIAIADYRSCEDSLIKSFIISVIGIFFIVLGGNLVVKSSSIIASNFGVSDNLIGLTIVAIGTSLPELVTSFIAATKGESDIAVGNVIGSNIFNILFILGFSSTLFPLKIDPALIFDSICMIIATAITYFFAFKNNNITKFESGSLIFLYICYMFNLINTM